ncbi:hypothetical protein ACHAXT_009106 [Thalassiosira profunda]
MTSAQEKALMVELAKARANKDVSCAKREEAKRLKSETRAKNRAKNRAKKKAEEKRLPARRRGGRSGLPSPGIPPPPPLSQEYLATIPEQYLRVMALTVHLYDRSSMTTCSNWFGAKARTFLKPPLHILGGYSSWKDVLHGIRHFNEMSEGERQREIVKARGLTRKQKAQLKANMDRLMADRPGRNMEGNVYDPPEQLEQLTAAAAARSEAATNHGSWEEIIRKREAATATHLTSASHTPHAADHGKDPATGCNGAAPKRMASAQDKALAAELAKARANKEASCAQREEAKRLKSETRAKKRAEEKRRKAELKLYLNAINMGGVSGGAPMPRQPQANQKGPPPAKRRRLSKFAKSANNLWSAREDDIIRKTVLAHPNPAAFQQWSALAEELPFLSGRSSKQIRARWKNQLDPQLDHSPFSRDDDVLLWESYKEHGSRWREISEQAFKGKRSENAVKNRWNGAAFLQWVVEEYGEGAHDKLESDKKQLEAKKLNYKATIARLEAHKKKAELRSKRKQRAESEKKQTLEAKKLNYNATIARLEATSRPRHGSTQEEEKAEDKRT